MSEQAVFVGADGRFVATELARGPWDPAAQHGGAPAALLMRAFEQLPVPDGQVMGRVTYELLRPVPLAALSAEAQVIRAGKRVQLLEGSLSTADGVPLVRARALRVQRADESSVQADWPAPPPGPEHGGEPDFKPRARPSFAPDAVEIRFISGAFYERGPSVAWFRLRAPIVAGERPSPLQSLAAAGDFGNGISAVLSWEEYVFINPDLTLYIDRPPIGEWICLQSQTWIPATGIGISESVLYDVRGRVGRATQSLVIARR
ncbi:MAG: thioesterase family protein [Solirubrobacterales bacterium]|nr:thioesterase family protein [Solirubrobacterales bacterium]